jgi:hypothetical protein
MTDESTFAEQAVTYLKEQGNAITELLVCGGPDIEYTREPPNWSAGPLVLGSPETLTAGRLVAAAAVAERDQRDLTVVTPTAADARWVGEILLDPVAGTSGDWTTVYSVDGRYWRDESTLYLSPPWEPSGTWQLAADGRLRYRIGDQTVAVGQLDQPLETFETGLAECRLQDSQYGFYGADGTDYGSTTDPAELARVGRPVELPVPPTRLHFAPTSTVLYVDGGVLKPVRPVTGVTAQPTTSRQWQKPIGAFLARYTVPATGSIGLSALRRQIRWWARTQFTTAVPDDEMLDRLVSASLENLRERTSQTEATLTTDSLQGRIWRSPQCSTPIIDRLNKTTPSGPLVELAETLTETEKHNDTS